VKNPIAAKMASLEKAHADQKARSETNCVAQPEEENDHQQMQDPPRQCEDLKSFHVISTAHGR
jgi:hypothetical protein